MQSLRKIEVTTGVWWVEAPDLELRVLCGCPADVVKHLMKRGLISPTEKGGIAYETGPNAILLSDVMVQNGSFSNLGEFPVLQMLYRQGMIIPGHPNNTGIKPLLLGSSEQVAAQMQYIYRGNYGLVTEEEMVEAGASPEEAHEMMRLKLKFAFGKIRHPGDLLDTLSIEGEPAEVRPGLTVRRLRLNVFEFSYKGETVAVDLNLPPFETYECPYPLGFYQIHREYFGIVHSGEGDGWDINRPSMGTVLMFQGRVYLIDAGPNILATLDALGIGVNEIEGVFHTHSHDDHFAGLTTLIRADHRIKYYATPLVRASVAKKMCALLSIEESAFADYFEVYDLVTGKYNDVDGLEVMPVFSPHPVETTVFMFRALWEDGWRTYAHLADICRLDVLKGFVTHDEKAPGLSQDWYDSIAADYMVPADVKKVDVGGGMIHGDAYDFRNDTSGKIILAHTSQRYTRAQKAIGSAASFGTVDIMIPSNQEFLWRTASELLQGYFPGIPQHQIRVLMNNPIKTFNPGTILVRERTVNNHIFLLLSGSVESIPMDSGPRSVLSAGAMVGELTGLFWSASLETYRAIGFVQALQIPCSLYGEFVRRNELFAEINRLLENREFLKRTWLFGEVVSSKTLNLIAHEMIPETFEEGELVELGTNAIAVVRHGRLGRFIGEQMIETVEPGDFLNEEIAIFQTPSLFRLRALEQTDLFLLPAEHIAVIPSVRWKLFEMTDKRVRALTEASHVGRALLRWHEEYRVDIQRIDNHHRRLFEMSNAVLDAVENGADLSEVLVALDSLAGYARYHFSEEEALLGRYGYPDSDNHHSRHESLLASLADTRAHIAKAGAANEVEVLSFLQDWLVSHILTEDRRYGPFLNDKGVY